MARRRRRSRPRGTVHRRRASRALEGRVRRVGPEHFGILAVDSAKKRFAVLLTDFYGRALMDVLEVANTRPALEGLVATVKAQCEKHGLKDLVVGIERTGRYHVPIRNVLRAHWDIRMVDPFATKQLRQPVDPGNKTDPTDLEAVVRAMIVGYGTTEAELPPRWAEWRLVSREREALVRKRAWVRVRIQNRLEALMPGYAELSADLWRSPVALMLARDYGSARALLAAGLERLVERVRGAGHRVERRTVARVLQWAAQASPPDPQAQVRHRLLCNQLELLHHIDILNPGLIKRQTEFAQDTQVASIKGRKSHALAVWPTHIKTVVPICILQQDHVMAANVEEGGEMLNQEVFEDRTLVHITVNGLLKRTLLIGPAIVHLLCAMGMMIFEVPLFTQ